MEDVLLGGLWLVITASGTRYLIDSRDADGPATIMRTAALTSEPWPYVSGSLRRDGEVLSLIAVHHELLGGGVAPGLVVGAGAVFTIEPLAPSATVTFRRTTPVSSLVRVREVGSASSPLLG